jgi:DNA-directed RNA polymerase sigma subunit (sigma70/sigma32)
MEPEYIDDPLGLYLKLASEVPPLTAAEEADLLNKARGTGRPAERARKTVLEAHLLEVLPIARRFEDSGIALLDLIIEGNKGLERAIDTFDPSLGITLSEHTGPYIERAIRDAVERA